MIYELHRIFSQGLMAGESRDDLNKMFDGIGVTIVYAPDYRRVYLDDSVDEKWAEQCRDGIAEAEPVEVDWKEMYRYDMIGRGVLHPYTKLDDLE